ncbi:MAG: hypothetical protein ABIJ34_05115 [archaeon]
MDENIIASAKDFISKARQSGQSDVEITLALQNAGWPEDIIKIAMQNSIPVISSIPEQPKEMSANAEAKPASAKSVAPANTRNQNDDLMQKAPVEIAGNSPPPLVPSKKGRKFCLMALIALMLSPVPFIGLGFAMTSLDMINKKNMSGTFVAIIALFINILTILFVLFLIYQIFTLDPSQLTGFSRYVNDMFQLV